MEIMTGSGPAQVELDQPAGPAFLLVLTHGSGGGVDSPDLLAARDAGLGLGGAVARVLQPYLVRGARAPGSPDRQDAAWLEIIEAVRPGFPAMPLVQGGRSNGARLACRTAAAAGARAVVALAFPLHPPGRPDRSRAAELRQAGVPVLVVNGDRDPFGVPDRADASRLVVLPGETHALSRHPRVIRQTVEAWLREVLAPSPLSLPGAGDQAAGDWVLSAGDSCRLGLTTGWVIRSVGRCGAMGSPSGSSSPVSSKTTMPLQSRLQPCSG
jgi:predicted alpha/beta-hydrolase family hydrolase